MPQEVDDDPQRLSCKQTTHDLALFTNTAVQVECLLHNLELAARGIGLYIDLDKTELMYFKQDGVIFTLNDMPQKLVDYFTYFSSNISSTKCSHTYRIGMDCYQQIINHMVINRLSIIWNWTRQYEFIW